MLRFLFEDAEPDERAQTFLGPERAEYLRAVADALEAVEDWNHDAIRAALDAVKAERELNSKQAYQPLRAAITGSR